MFIARLRTFQWGRGVRAAVAVGSAMVVCHMLGKPAAGAALGAFNALLVDNGGPYRTRLITMATALLGGSLALVAGAMVPQEVGIAMAATAAVSFAIIFARVLSQPMASSAVLILVLYFAGLGGSVHTVAGLRATVTALLLGGMWAAALSLALWPTDPFRPARLAVAECYRAAAESGGADADVPRGFEWRRQQRVRIEAARMALANTAARAPSRTARARNLTVLLETADLLLARVARLTELDELAASSGAADAEVKAHVGATARWLAGASRAIADGLAHKPADGGAAFSQDGSQRMQWIVRRREELKALPEVGGGSLQMHVLDEEREAALEMETAFDAVWAVWTGSEVRRNPWIPAAGTETSGWNWSWIDSSWRDSLRANWTMKSAMLRHTLRVTAVAVVDVVAMRAMHINHGFWLPMTSIILLQPYSAGTARKSVQRVTGTVAGGVLAALLAVTLPGAVSLIVVVTALAMLTLATFAVDYALYCFFLTPTFVLLSLPHPHDWRYAGIRIGTTLAGATIAILAMRLLWPERAEEELGRLLRRGAGADAAYLRAMLQFWTSEPGSRRRTAEREVLAPARRACGLTSNDAEEAVDRVMQEPQFGRVGDEESRVRNEALTSATYLRRLTQSITTLAVVGQGSPQMHGRLERLAERMDGLAAGVAAGPGGESDAIKYAVEGSARADLAEEQVVRIERQIGILERAGAGFREVRSTDSTT